MTRIGTWNLAGKWSDAHQRLLVDLDCDVLLLTEVRRDVELASYHRHLTQDDMAARRAWAGIYSRQPLVPLPDPHPASALAEIRWHRLLQLDPALERRSLGDAVVGGEPRSQDRRDDL